MADEAFQAALTLKRRAVLWQMRRGLLELDIYLRRFGAAGVNALSAQELDDLAAVLQWPDPQILAVLNGGEPSPMPHYEPLLHKIRTPALAPQPSSLQGVLP